jgi:tetratricopeptide (TPR) repeat protein
MPMKNSLQSYSILVSACALLSLVSSCSHFRANDRAPADQQSRRDYSGNPYAHFLIGVTMENQGRFEEAIRELLRALENDGESLEIYRSLGFCYFMREDYENAYKYTALAMELKPRDPDILFRQGMNLYKLQRDDEAIEVLRTSISLDPDPHPKCYYLLGSLYDRQRRVEKALEHYMKYVSLDPRSSEVWYRLGMLQIESGAPEIAKTHFEKAVFFNPHDLRSYYELGNLYETEENYTEALSWYKKILFIQSDNPRILKKLGNLSLKAGDIDDSIEYYQRVLALLPQNHKVRYMLALLYFQEKDLIEAQHHFQMLLSVDPDNPEYNLYMGKIFFQKQLYGEAISFFSRSEQHVDSAAMQVDILKEKAAIYIMTMQYVKAEADIEKALSLKPDDGSLYFIAGLLEIERQNPERIRHYFQKALNHGFESDYIQFTLGTIFYDNRELDKAEHAFKRTIELNGEYAPAYNYLAYMYAEQGTNLNVALKLIRRAIELDPENGYYIDSLGWIYYRMGKLEQALDSLKEARSLVADDPVIYDHLGEVYLSMGQYDMAEESWRKSLKLDESITDVREKLKQLDKNHHN